MNKQFFKLMALVFVLANINCRLLAQVNTPIGEYQSGSEDYGSFRDMPWMHVHEHYTIVEEKTPDAKMETAKNEVKQYLYDCLTPQQIEILAKWIRYLKEHGLPEDSKQYAAVKIHLMPATYNKASLPPAISRVIKKN